MTTSNWDVEAQNIEQRRKYADLLRAQSMEPINPGQTPGVAISPFQGLAKIFKAYTAGQSTRKAEEDAKSLATRRNQALADVLKGAFSPVPGQVAQMGEMGEQVAPAVPQRQRTPQEISQALLANPDTMQLGGQMMVEGVKGQADMDRALQLEALKQQIKATIPSEMPSDIRSFREFQKMSPAEQQAFLNKQRQQYQISDIGNVPNLVARMPGVAPTPLSTLPAEVEGKAAVARGVESGKALGEADTSLVEMKANLPRLEVVVNQLDTLGGKATYTKAGQVRDIVQRELGMDPREEAVARKEYISKVDNEVLPLLRQTFGAQFTQKEGESLKATLGDPNASPAEKTAVLRSFIDSKRAQVETQKRKVGLPTTPSTTPVKRIKLGAMP